MPMSGKDMLKIFESYGRRKVRQKGSYVIVQKDGEPPETIPLHRELKNGLERKLLNRLGVKK
jgi:predicted RNA binding protein YcfA (HicA-like mRNA interferase family)